MKTALQNLIKASNELVGLHQCEQEGLSSGQPTSAQWYKAVEDLEEAISEAEKALENYTDDSIIAQAEKIKADRLCKKLDEVIAEKALEEKPEPNEFHSALADYADELRAEKREWQSKIRQIEELRDNAVFANAIYAYDKALKILKS